MTCKYILQNTLGERDGFIVGRYGVEGSMNVVQVLHKPNRRKIRLIESNSKLTSPLTHCIRVYSILIHTGKGGRADQREGYWGNSSQRRSKIPTSLTVSPVYRLY
jgi:hypothetical protein